MTADLTDEDRGKTVIHGTERVGTVTDVRSGTAYVDVEFDHVPDGLRDALGWREGDPPHTLDEDAVTAVANSEVRLRETL